MSTQEMAEALETPVEKYRKQKWEKMFVSRSVITSQAFLSLRTAAACQVYMIFLNKCKYEKAQMKPGKRDKVWTHTNNGELQFTYKEAEEKWGIKEGKFMRAIEQLVEVGLLDITKPGFGLQGDVSLYAISDRWEKFGTDAFVHKDRPKRKQKFGFTEGNGYGKNSSKKSQPLQTNTDQQLVTTATGDSENAHHDY
jgi:hypothetical protein